jgi:ADP-ribose pyrophosphatase YjhB (NUDIX family)
MVNGKPSYCSNCGSELGKRHIDGRHRLYCSECVRVRYRNPKPCAGTLVVDGNKLLLVERTEPPDVGSWSVPAGYLEHEEPPESAAVRELHEETNLQVSADAVDLFDTTFVRHTEGPNVLVLVYVVASAKVDGQLEAGDDACDARFWSLSNLRARGDRIEDGYEGLFEAAVNTDMITSSTR